MWIGRKQVIGAGLAAFRATRLHRALAPLTRGRGAILAFHRIAEAPAAGAFAPNAGLAITPAFLDAVLGFLRRNAIRIVPLDAVLPRLAARGGERFVALTFDDGYRDTLDAARPVLERHEAPFTTFVTTGFADRTARLWWLDLEAAIAGRDAIACSLDGVLHRWPTRTAAEKTAAFGRIAARLRQASPAIVLATLAELGCEAEAGRRRVAELCLDWGGIAALARHPLATLGCHTETHPCLAALPEAAVHAELAAARTLIADRTGASVHHLAYPYGGPTAAGPREFAVAAALGFTSAVTTRPGVLHAGDAATPMALPRVSVNGLWPSLDTLDILLSGAPFLARRLQAVLR